MKNWKTIKDKYDEISVEIVGGNHGCHIIWIQHPLQKSHVSNSNARSKCIMLAVWYCVDITTKDWGNRGNVQDWNIRRGIVGNFNSYSSG